MNRQKKTNKDIVVIVIVNSTGLNPFSLQSCFALRLPRDKTYLHDDKGALREDNCNYLENEYLVTRQWL